MCGGILYLLQEIKVRNVIIGKQFESSENYEEFLKIVKEKNIKVIQVETKDKINVEKNIYFDILWPDSNQEILENGINNNAIVCKLNYINFSMIFTGDIEQEAEKKLISKYMNTNVLNATVLKVAHHGSKTSSSQEFLQLVNPKIALIGVGKDNNFGHPNQDVIDRIKKYTNKIYRTDLNGEIEILVKGNNSKIKCINFVEK